MALVGCEVVHWCKGCWCTVKEDVHCLVIPAGCSIVQGRVAAQGPHVLVAAGSFGDKGWVRRMGQRLVKA